MKELCVILIVCILSVIISHSLPTQQRFAAEMLEREKTMQAEVDAACGVLR